MMKNLVVISVAFLLLFTAYHSLQNLQSSLNEEGNLGIISLIIIYTTFIISCMLIPPAMIGRIGCKWTIVASMSCYVSFIAANYYPRWYTLGFTSAILGFGAAPLWSAQSAYLTTTAISYAKNNNSDQDATIARFFGIFYMVLQSSQVWGNIISSTVLQQSDESMNLTFGYDVAGACGADDCGQALSQKNSSVVIAPEQSTVVILVTIYLVCGLLSSAVVALLLDKLRSDQATKTPTLQLFLATLRQLRDVRMLLIIQLTFYSGQEQGFLFADFTKSFITCVYGIEKVGYVMICYGLNNALFSYILGKMIKCVGRIPIFLSGALTQLACHIVLLSWQPERDVIAVVFVIAGLWGYSDAILQTQISALFGILFHDSQEAAFSNLRLWQSLGFVINFSLSSVLCVSVKVYMLIAVLTLGMVLYCAVEVKQRRASQDVRVSTVLSHSSDLHVNLNQ